MAAQKEDQADSKSKTSAAGAKTEKSVEAGKKGEVERERRTIPPPQQPRPDPERKLKELEEKLKQLLQQSEQLKIESQSCKDDKTKLETLLGEFAKILANYIKALGKIKEDATELKKYSDKKTDMIKTAIEGHEGEIKDLIDGVERDISDLQNKADGLKSDMDRAKSNFDLARQNHEEKQKALDDLKTRQQYIEGNHKAMNKLRDRIEKEEEGSKYAVMYYLMEEFNAVLGRTSPAIITEGQLKTLLYLAWQQLDSAEDDLQAKEALFKTAEQEYADAAEKLKQAQDKKRDSILEKLSQIEF